MESLFKYNKEYEELMLNLAKEIFKQDFAVDVVDEIFRRTNPVMFLTMAVMHLVDEVRELRFHKKD